MHLNLGGHIFKKGANDDLNTHRCATPSANASASSDIDRFVELKAFEGM